MRDNHVFMPNAAHSRSHSGAVRFRLPTDTVQFRSHTGTERFRSHTGAAFTFSRRCRAVPFFWESFVL